MLNTISLTLLLMQSVSTLVEQARPLLWRDLREGMSPEEFAESLRQIDGIKTVEVIRKGAKPPKVKINYVNGGGINIGTMNVAVNPEFENDRLRSVTLSQTSCYSTITAISQAVSTALVLKYGHKQRVMVTDDNNVVVDVRYSFYNDETRVTTATIPVENTVPNHVYGGGRFVQAMNDLANNMADEAYNKALTACPEDGGRKGVLLLEYRSQTAFMIANAQQQAERNANSKATKDGL